MYLPLIINGKPIDQQTLAYYVRAGMIRLDAEYEPTVGEIIERRKAQGDSYEETIKKLTQIRKL